MQRLHFYAPTEGEYGMREKGTRRRALRAAFPHTIPILTGFWFLGMAHGIIMAQKGFSFLYPTLMAIIVFGGSLEYVAVELLLSAFAPLQALATALLVQARHLFYGIAMLDKFKGLGWKRFYLIFGMCDETFSINCTAQVPDGVDRGWFMFFVTLLDQVYWVSANALGGLLGSLITIDIEGLDFVMTAMFVVIFLEQWLKDKRHETAIIGVGTSVVCLLVFGPERFLLPTMASILCLLTLLRRPIESESAWKAGDRA